MHLLGSWPRIFRGRCTAGPHYTSISHPIASSRFIATLLACMCIFIHAIHMVCSTIIIVSVSLAFRLIAFKYCVRLLSKFYRRHYDLVSKSNTGLYKQGLSERILEKTFGRNDFFDQLRKIIIRCKRIGYNMNVMRQTACLVVNPITVNNFAALFNCTPAGRASDLMMAPAWNFQWSWLGLDDLSLVEPTGVQLLDFFCSSVSVLVLLLSTHLFSSQ